MKKHMPKATDLAIFATLALILAAIATTAGSVGAWLAVLSAPLFLVSALYGMHKSGRFAEQRVPVKIEARQDVPVRELAD